MTRLIAVAGSGSCSTDESTIAREVGRLLAQKGFGVVCGGLGGVMQGACKGCMEAGGMTVGILPGLSFYEANPFVQVAIPTGMGEGRNVLVVRSADAVIAIGGEYGTLSEIALALKIGKKVLGLNTWGLMRAGRNDDGIQVVSSPEEAVRLATS